MAGGEMSRYPGMPTPSSPGCSSRGCPPLPVRAGPGSRSPQCKQPGDGECHGQVAAEINEDATKQDVWKGQ